MAKKVKTDYIQPSAKAVALITELADQLANHIIANKQNRFDLYVLATGIRRAHLNKKTDTYSVGFEDWYRKNELKQVSGESGNFSKFSSAGEVVAYVRKMDTAEKYLNQLPVCKGVLYECWLILQPRKRPREHYKEEFKRCLTMHATRKSVDETRHE